MLIDTHCHLHDREFFSDSQASEMLQRAKLKNVLKVVCIGTSHADSLEAQKFSIRYGAETPVENEVEWTYGIHPENANTGDAKFSEIDKGKLKEIFREKPPVAIGEVGLDYHYDGYNRAAQIRLFEEMLELAKDNNLPLSFHVREAFDDFFAVIKNFPEVRGVVHSFSDNKKNLKRILETTDFYVGINGMATYSTLPTPPLSRTLLETDAPFLTPKPFRGIINEPSHVFNVAVWLAEKTGQCLEVIERETTENARKLFLFQTPEARPRYESGF